MHAKFRLLVSKKLVRNRFIPETFSSSYADIFPYICSYRHYQLNGELVKSQVSILLPFLTFPSCTHDLTRCLPILSAETAPQHQRRLASSTTPLSLPTAPHLHFPITVCTMPFIRPTKKAPGQPTPKPRAHCLPSPPPIPKSKPFGGIRSRMLHAIKTVILPFHFKKSPELQLKTLPVPAPPKNKSQLPVSERLRSPFKLRRLSKNRKGDLTLYRRATEILDWAVPLLNHSIKIGLLGEAKHKHPDISRQFVKLVKDARKLLVELDNTFGKKKRKEMERRFEELEKSRKWVSGRMEGLERSGEREQKIKKWEEVWRKHVMGPKDFYVVTERQIGGEKTQLAGVVYFLDR